MRSSIADEASSQGRALSRSLGGDRRRGLGLVLREEVPARDGRDEHRDHVAGDQVATVIASGTNSFFARPARSTTKKSTAIVASVAARAAIATRSRPPAPPSRARARANGGGSTRGRRRRCRRAGPSRTRSCSAVTYRAIVGTTCGDTPVRGSGRLSWSVRTYGGVELGARVAATCNERRRRSLIDFLRPTALALLFRRERHVPPACFLLVPSSSCPRAVSDVAGMAGRAAGPTCASRRAAAALVCAAAGPAATCAPPSDAATRSDAACALRPGLVRAHDGARRHDERARQLRGARAHRRDRC